MPLRDAAAQVRPVDGPAVVPGYAFDGAIADFAEAYADLNERDFRAYRAAIKEGRIPV
jgi:hypothetical protein